MEPKQTRLRALHWQAERLADRLAALDRHSNRLSWLRLITFAAGTVISSALLLVLPPGATVFGWLVTLIAFAAVARIHRRVTHSIRRHTLYLGIKRAHLARAQIDWAGLPPPLITTSRSDHPAELDLDLVGERSLHRLLDCCVTRDGSLRLRDWLAADTPELPALHTRQQIVLELVPLVAFRDKLQLHAAISMQGAWRRWDGKALREWLESVDARGSTWITASRLTALSALTILLFLLHLLAVIPAWWGLTFMLYAGLYLWQVQRNADPFSLGLALQDPLNDLGAVFTHLESFPYAERPGLRALCAPFLDRQTRPSHELARLSRVLAAASVRRNPLLWTMVSAVLPWDLIVLAWLKARRNALFDLLPRWLEVWFELEALSSLAALAYLNPDYVFPQIDRAPDAPVLTARNLGHPLIPDTERVCNDFAFDTLGALALITGSNMSGKSTFLRTLGIALALAYAGGPVSAGEFRTQPLRLFTCIRVTDSLADGISYFYAEVKRLKALLVALQPSDTDPVLFLIDEIFRGTNNRERLIGSRAYIRALLDGHGAGALSTHDLELVQLADVFPQVSNYHFAETIDGGRMHFDYRLRPGPCPTTNALTIMRMEGLPVGPDGT